MQRRGADSSDGGHIDPVSTFRAMSTSMGLKGMGRLARVLAVCGDVRSHVARAALRIAAASIDRDPLPPRHCGRTPGCSSSTGQCHALRAPRLMASRGEPRRVAARWRFESGPTKSIRPARPRRRLTEQAKVLAGTVGDPHAIALSCLADGMMTMARGEWKPALKFSEEALTILRDRCVGVTWELNMAQNLVIWALMYLGELGEVSRRVPELLDQARRSGNLYIATELCTRSNYVWLAADEPEEGERVTVDSIARWSQKGFHRQHYSAVLARIQTALYRGDAPTAWRLLDDLESVLRHTRLTRVQVMRVESHYLRARSACDGGDLGPPAAIPAVARAARAASPVSAGRGPDPISLLISAAVAHLEGTGLALERLHEAAARSMARTCSCMRRYQAPDRRPGGQRPRRAS